MDGFRALKIFVVMPFDPEFNDLYELIKGVMGSDKVSVFRADDLLHQQNILKDVVVSINNSDLIVADLTGLNPNVFYELGLAHALRKDVILLTQDISELPFDLRSYRVVQYSTNFAKIKEFELQLSRIMEDILTGEFSFGSPITDWLPQANSTNLVAMPNLSNLPRGSAENVQGDKDEDKGLIDYMADMDESMTQLVALVDEFTIKTEEMGQEVNKNGLEIQRATKHGAGSGAAAFVRKVARRTAETLNDYGAYLTQQNMQYESLWNTFEDGIAGILLSPHSVVQVEDEPNLREFMGVMEGLRAQMIPAKDSINEMAESASSLKGVESSMTRAVSLIEREMKGFAGLLDKSVSTLDRIVLVVREKLKAIEGIR